MQTSRPVVGRRWNPAVPTNRRHPSGLVCLGWSPPARWETTPSRHEAASRRRVPTPDRMRLGRAAGRPPLVEWRVSPTSVVVRSTGQSVASSLCGLRRCYLPLHARRPGARRRDRTLEPSGLERSQSGCVVNHLWWHDSQSRGSTRTVVCSLRAVASGFALVASDASPIVGGRGSAPRRLGITSSGKSESAIPNRRSALLVVPTNRPTWHKTHRRRPCTDER